MRLSRGWVEAASLGQTIQRLKRESTVSKTIFSQQVQAGIFRFVAFKKLLEGEAGYTSNEPAQLAVKEAIEAGILHLIAQGVRDRQWFLSDEKDFGSPVLQEYLRESGELIKVSLENGVPPWR